MFSKMLLGASIVASTLSQQPSFDVVSIKLSPPGANGADVDVDHDMVRMRNITLRRMMTRAYSVPDGQIEGGASWTTDMHYDVDAKADHQLKDSDEVALLLKSLLAERFNLKVHTEQKEMSGYALVLPANHSFLGKKATPDQTCEINKSRTHIHVTGCSVARFVSKLSGVLEVPVTDGTSLEGSYNFDLRWTNDQLPGNAVTPALPETDVPSLPVALQEQLGLRLEKRKVLATVIRIDEVERPSPN